MIFQYAYEIDDKKTPERLVALAQKYKTLCDIEVKDDRRYFFITFEGENLEAIADLYDTEVANAGYKPGLYWENYQ